jgi:predicted phage gp36 major capsid-like protein
VLLSGDFSQYAIVDRLGATVEHLPLLVGANRRPTGERGWFLYWRTGADVLIPDAFRITNHSA